MSAVRRSSAVRSPRPHAFSSAVTSAESGLLDTRVRVLRAPTLYGCRCVELRSRARLGTSCLWFSHIAATGGFYEVERDALVRVRIACGGTGYCRGHDGIILVAGGRRTRRSDAPAAHHEECRR